MKISVIGTRGIPDIQGGVETHCQELFPRLVKLGYEVTLFRRSGYTGNQKDISIFRGVRLIDLYSPRIKSLEAIVHTFLAVLYSGLKRPDILHIHAIGPSVLTPLAKLLGLKVVVTNHGSDYDRQKWGPFAKKVLKLGERWGSVYADKVIVISKTIAGNINKTYRRTDTVLIYNGVTIPVKSINTDYIASLKLERGKYILGIGRFVVEKGFHDLIEAYKHFEMKDYKLVLAGDADHETEYSKNLKDLALKNNVILTGFIKGENLNQIYSNARLFILPSYHEGLPISLLEAMSYNLDVLASDIPANKELDLEKDDYFSVGNIRELTNKITRKLETNKDRDFSGLLKTKYNWDTIAEQTSKVYFDVIK